MQIIDNTSKQDGQFKFRIVVERNSGSTAQYLVSTKKAMIETAWALQCAHKSVAVFSKTGEQVL